MGVEQAVWEAYVIEGSNRVFSLRYRDFAKVVQYKI